MVEIESEIPKIIFCWFPPTNEEKRFIVFIRGIRGGWWLISIDGSDWPGMYSDKSRVISDSPLNEAPVQLNRSICSLQRGGSVSIFLWSNCECVQLKTREVFSVTLFTGLLSLVVRGQCRTGSGVNQMNIHNQFEMVFIIPPRDYYSSLRCWWTSNWLGRVLLEPCSSFVSHWGTSSRQEGNEIGECPNEMTPNSECLCPILRLSSSSVVIRRRTLLNPL